MNKNKKKTSLIKKLLKWLLAPLLILLIVLTTIPFLFKDKIVQMVTNTINNNINATVTFKEADLSLLRSFPLASLTVSNVAVINKIPFKGDTLYHADRLSLDMSITELFKKESETIDLKNISTSNGAINIVINKDNIANYDIAIKKDTVASNENNNGFSFNIQSYEVENIQFNYTDEISKIKLQLDRIYHTGQGNFAKDILELDTETTAQLSFDMDNANYFNHVAITLDAILEIDLKNTKFTFKENTGKINQLDLTFDGFIQLLEDTQLYDIHFKTPTSSFKNALALLPKQYSGNLSTITTQGNFDLDGVVKGTLSEKTIPTFNISFTSKNAQFKYADLPKSVKNIYLDSRIINTTGKTKDTYINLNNLAFKIDEDAFKANGNISNITTNPALKIAAKGVINLANIGKVYPVSLEKQLAGILKADVTTNFDMNSIDKGRYQNVKNSGTLSVNDFKYNSNDVANPFFIDKTSIIFNTNTIQLTEFKAKTGSSDISLRGNLENFYGFLFKDQVLKGNFILNSNTLKIADFISEKESEKTSSSSVKIPAFIDASFNATAKTVVYDNITLKNVSGDLFIKDENVRLQNLKSDVFGGIIGLNGNVSTKGETSNFTMDLDLKQLNIAESFSSLDMLKSIAPIAKTIEGKINSTLKVSGNLKEDMTPDLKTISGNLLGQLLSTKLKASNSNILSALSSKIDFVDVNKLNLDKIQTYISFKNGEASIKPFQLNYKDIGIEIGGSHGFDQTMNYNLTFDVPVKYLGTEAIDMLNKLSSKDAESVKNIPVKAILTGSFSNPSFTTNLKDATSNLVNNLIQKQKESLKEKGKNKLKDLLNLNTPKKDSIKKDSTKTKDKVKDILGGLFGKKKNDSTKKGGN